MKTKFSDKEQMTMANVVGPQPDVVRELFKKGVTLIGKKNIKKVRFNTSLMQVLNC